jgi:hypothetical protein
MEFIIRLFSYIKGLFSASRISIDKGVFSTPDVISPVLNSPGKFVFYCPGCEDYHTIDTTPHEKKRFHVLTGKFSSPTVRESVLSKGSQEKPTCHAFITNGKIEFLKDSTHSLAGQTVALKPF